MRQALTDFIWAEKTLRDGLKVPGLCIVVSHPHSAQHHEERFLSFSSSEEDLRFLISRKTYFKMPITSLTEELIPIETLP
jgi:hypothetical protein